ncbi:MAG: hypothetical protein R3Y06_07035 [Faecalibacterium sp.]
MASKAQLEANKRYFKSIEDIKLRVKKGARARYKTAAELNGKSLNSYVIDLIESDIEGNEQTAHLANNNTAETTDSLSD